MGNFQKILILTILYCAFTLAKKKRSHTVDSESNPFGDYDIVLNPPLEGFEDYFTKSNNLIFLYVFDSKQDRSTQLTEQILKPIMDELKGYLKFYAFDCQNETVSSQKERFKMC